MLYVMVLPLLVESVCLTLFIEGVLALLSHAVKRMMIMLNIMG